MLRISAPAKVNLHLGVHDERDARGYHRVDSVMVALDVCDWLDIEVADKTTISCIPDINVGRHSNTAFRAWEELSARFDEIPPVKIRIDKRLPAEAGLGGGSSDAGAVLRALCQMSGIDVKDERVQEAARAVGADVPFFLDMRPMLLKGAGDVPDYILSRFCEIWMVLARAEGPGVCTKAAYDSFDRVPVDPGDPAAICAAFEMGDVNAVGRLLSNNLEHVARALVPQIDEVLDVLNACEGVLGSTVCGSGSCCFAVCETRSAAESCLIRVASTHPHWWTRAACTLHI